MGQVSCYKEVCVSYVVEGGCHEKNCRKRILGRGKSEDQGPEAGKGAVCWSVAGVAGWAWWGNRWEVTLEG